jgi:ABC-type nitrate/sulfonate/bicarbonate transport system permease component
MALIIYREESLCTYAKRRSMPFLSLGHSQRISRWRAAVAWQISPRWRALATAGLSVAAFVVLWQIASARDAETILFPGPVATVKAVLALLNEGVLSVDVRVSLVRIGVGFALGVVVGVPLGLAMGTFPPVKIFFEPYIQFFRFVPAIAWLVPAILWFGIGELSKIFLIVYTTVFLVMLNTMVGVASVRRNQIRAAQCFGAGPWQRYAWVILPATMLNRHVSVRPKLATLLSHGDWARCHLAHQKCSAPTEPAPPCQIGNGNVRQACPIPESPSSSRASVRGCRRREESR